MSVDSEGRPLPEDENAAQSADAGASEAAPNPAAEETAPVEAASESPVEAAATPEPEAEADAPEEAAPKRPVSSGPAPPVRVTRDRDYDDDDGDEPVEPLEYFAEAEEEEAGAEKDWYILKVAVNRETTVADALLRRVKMEGLEEYVDEVVVPTEEVTEFTKTGKKRKVKKKLFPGYIVVHMAITDATWFLVRETTGIGDFTGSAGKPSPLPEHEVDRLLARSKKPTGEEPAQINIPFKVGDRVRINEGNFQSFEGDVAAVDPNSGDVRVEIVIFNRTTPVDFKHWQLESI